MQNSALDDLVIEISRDLVAQLAPEELPLFRVTSQAFLQNPKRVLAGQGAGDDMLGFGLGDAVALLTPAALAVASSVLTFLVAEMTKAASTEGKSLVQDTVHQLFKKIRSPTKSNGKQLPPLTTEQLVQVRAIALKHAHQMKLSDPRAKVLADAIVGSLVTTIGV